MTRGTVRMRDEVRLGRRRKKGEDGKKELMKKHF